jgi:hypothetical protein
MTYEITYKNGKVVTCVNVESHHTYKQNGILKLELNYYCTSGSSYDVIDLNSNVTYVERF